MCAGRILKLKTLDYAVDLISLGLRLLHVLDSSIHKLMFLIRKQRSNIQSKVDFHYAYSLV